MAVNPLRVLHVIGAMDRGGAETLVMNLYRNMDRDKIQFDFLVNDMDGRDYDEEIRDLGGRLHQIPRYNVANYLTYSKACRSFFNSHPYSIVHGHIGLPAPIYLKEAQKAGAFCIAHSHAQNFPISPSELVFRTCTYPTRFVADYFMACSEQAGIDRYGASVCQLNRFHVLKNGIDVEQARFSPICRSNIRNALGLPESAPVFGHVGRLTPVKNHGFLLEVFASILKELPQAHLILVGRGEEENKLKNKARNLGITDEVHFLGIRDDVAAVLSAIDVFIFPSIREGLANAVIEAQASGARCLISTGVPELARISPQTIFAPLEGPSVSKWSNLAIQIYKDPLPDRSLCVNDARKMGFDIKDSAKWLANLYTNVASFSDCPNHSSN